MGVSMGRNYFKNARERMSQALIVPMFLLFSLMLVIGLGLMFEDISTTYAGYTALPTLKINDWVSILVSLSPTAVQIGMAYAYLSDKGNRWGAALAGMLFLFDMGTDVAYKAGNSSDPWVWLLAIFESFLVFTILSEGMTTLSIGMLHQLWPDFLSIMRQITIPNFGFADEEEEEEAPVRPVTRQTSFNADKPGGGLGGR